MKDKFGNIPLNHLLASWAFFKVNEEGSFVDIVKKIAQQSDLTCFRDKD